LVCQKYINFQWNAAFALQHCVADSGGCWGWMFVSRSG
jgi:hypothetical protein